MDFHEFLGLARSGIKRLSMAEGNDLILPAMEDKNGAREVRQILERTVLVGHEEFREKPGQAVPGGFLKRNKSGFEDERLRFIRPAYPGRNGTPQRPAEDDDLLRIRLSDLNQVIPGGL